MFRFPGILFIEVTKTCGVEVATQMKSFAAMFPGKSARSQPRILGNWTGKKMEGTFSAESESFAPF